MKKVVSGASILITGAILFLSVSIAAGMNMQFIGEWDTNAGRFWTSVISLKIMPFVVISAVIMAVGLCMIIWGNISKSDSIINRR